MIKTVGSVCSGIEAASVAWQPLGVEFKWFSEIAPFPSSILEYKYPHIPNLGDMNDIENKILNQEIDAPDLICGGTPCQAFSLAGWQNGLKDDRGNLTLKFVDIIEANDVVRSRNCLNDTYVFWENVEGVLKDKTNAFGCLISSLAGLPDAIKKDRWPNAGLLRGPKRNVAWRVLDAKYFGLPQQRRRLYVIAGGKNFSPECVLFERHRFDPPQYPDFPLVFSKEEHEFEIFRAYTDCLYAAYGTKWNGNAAAYNGSLYVAQDNRLRRLSALECERLMGLPDNYTKIPNAKKTNRYQGIGNSWAVPVIKWLGERLIANELETFKLKAENDYLSERIINDTNTQSVFFDFGKDIIRTDIELSINCTEVPEICNFTSMEEIITHEEATEDIFISPVGCSGIIRRKVERNLSINPRLEKVLHLISSQMSAEEIEKRSKVQKRGKYSNNNSSKRTAQEWHD